MAHLNAQKDEADAAPFDARQWAEDKMSYATYQDEHSRHGGAFNLTENGPRSPNDPATNHLPDRSRRLIQLPLAQRLLQLLNCSGQT